MSQKPRSKKNRLKVRIPFAFEAEGEGLAPILCIAGLCALFIVLLFLK
jgi:hypothetical protein